MKTWKVIIGDGHQKPVEAKTARGAILAVIAQLGPNAYSAGVHEVRVWPVDDVGAPTAAAKVSIGAGRVVGLMARHLRVGPHRTTFNLRGMRAVTNARSSSAAARDMTP